ncbi:MAG TPA: Uma2 family endonuclease [Thermoanaerobaculia bacterium]|nr:Uma2 family endonuclease [Thermoanaerobaculia bacterium]
MTAIPFRQEVYYPESDGQPMGETDSHRREMTDLIEALEDRYRNDPQVYVAGNLFLYYAEGDPRAVICPDVFLVHGVAKRQRRVYKLWEEEGRVPAMVIEVTSRDTSREDTSQKKSCYERLGVEEYFLHDLFGEYLNPRLQGFRLVGGHYRPMDLTPAGALISQTTGLVLQLEGASGLRLVDAATGEPLLRVQESKDEARREKAARLAAEERIEQEAAARVAAEERARALEAELLRFRQEMERGQKDG